VTPRPLVDQWRPRSSHGARHAAAGRLPSSVEPVGAAAAACWQASPGRVSRFLLGTDRLHSLPLGRLYLLSPPSQVISTLHTLEPRLNACPSNRAPTTFAGSPRQTSRFSVVFSPLVLRLFSIKNLPSPPPPFPVSFRFLLPPSSLVSLLFLTSLRSVFHPLLPFPPPHFRSIPPSLAPHLIR